MAGRKQHYIPQVVQRAFEAARSGTKSQVLVCRKGRQAYLTSTEGVGAERDFYSNPLTDGKLALDDEITDFESYHLVPMLRELRSSENSEVDPELAAITVAHLAFRTAHIRGSMTTLVGSAFEQMRSIVDSPEALRRFAEIDSLSSNSSAAKMVCDELSRFGLNTWSEKDRKTVAQIAMFRIRERFDDLAIHAHRTISDQLNALGSKFADSIPRAHARALSESLVPQERVRALRQLNWRIIASDSVQRHFILPDCVVAACSHVSEKLRPFVMLPIGEVATVVMPLSPRQILVGCASVAHVPQADINLQLARCALEFFISSKEDESTESISSFIGEFAAELKLDLLGDEHAESTNVPVSAFGTARNLVIRAPAGRFGNSAKKVLSAIVKEGAEQTTIDRIDSITVPANMRATLTAIWKREPTAEELQAANLGTVEPVKSGSEWKCCVIVPREVVEVLVQPSDSDRRLYATRTVKLSLGRAYYFDCWVRCDPSIFDKPVLDHWNHVVLRVVFRVASFYFGGLASARHELEPLPGGESLQDVASHLRFGFAGLREARQRFLIHRDVNRLTLDAVQFIELILTSTASACGFLEAKNRSMARESDAGILLASVGLWDWCALFAEDLRRHYEKRNRWTSEAELHQLAGHVERHLWTIGVIVSKTDGGHWIDVLDDDHMLRVKQMLST